MIIAITGKLGSGKSTVAGLFENKGFLVIDADKIGHDVLKLDKIKNKIKEAFGDDVIDSKGQVIRNKLAEKVFIGKRSVTILNNISHPELIKRLRYKVEEYKTKYPKKDIVIDAALYYELDLKSLVDKTIVVKADEEIVLSRIKKYDFQRVRYRKELVSADYIIYNNTDRKILKMRVDWIVEQLKKK